MPAYYNEIDKFAVAWLRELIRGGHIAKGEVDDRPIQEVRPADLVGFDQCHFFAGIGGWSLALRLAGWGDERPVWTGSCPCQPFSQAGKGEGEEDPRHLWPDFFRLIRESAPNVVFGEQVAGPDGSRWLAGVHTDLEAISYRLGAATICSAGEGAPNIRERLYWVSYTDSNGWEPRQRRHYGENDRRTAGPVCTDLPFRLPHAGGAGLPAPERQERPGAGPGKEGGATGEPGVSRFWDRHELITGRDGKTRRIEPGLSPLAAGVPGRMGRLRAYGNAINPWVAKTFIEVVMEELGIAKEKHDADL